MSCPRDGREGAHALSAKMRRRAGWGCLALALGLGAACVQIGSEPDVPAAIELTALPSPSVVVGDTLRDDSGAVAPVVATVRNLSGDVIVDAPVRYLYADYSRDSALQVDSVSGIVVALKTASGSSGRLAARVGSSLQVLRQLAVVLRPDSVDRVGQSPIDVFTTTLPDTGRNTATANTSPALTIVVRHVDTTANTTPPVGSWRVRFELLQPANASNDTTKSVFLVDEVGRPSVLDTTDNGGVAGRRVRIRATQFPAAGVTDSVIVRAVVTYKRDTLAGAPLRLALPVRRAGS